jgi:hypothetical protein
MPAPGDETVRLDYRTPLIHRHADLPHTAPELKS